MAFMDFLERYPIDKLYLCDTYVVDELEHFDSTNLPELRGVRMAKKILYAYAADDKAIINVVNSTGTLYCVGSADGTYVHETMTNLSNIFLFFLK